ncbi:MAG: prolyl oligopeptidase family serine peptidase [Candidatus Dormibacteraeota bacterium]|nr:prolyl oligopeptidase family serine peptidase [Candidatus Dormibacteraeota bacterium]MBO0761445.1 prolyl oligopeptidase family serine peptidase [Candidatus Dormibacteraeota bacterium]
MPPPRHADWFAYFPDDYRWSAAVMLLLGAAPAGGADMGEVDRAGRALRSQVGDDEAWFRVWWEEAGRARRIAEQADAQGRTQTAAGAYLRACAYAQIGERFRTPKDAAALTCYRESIEGFLRFAELTGWPHIEPVEVPYEGTCLPAYLVQGERRSPGPPPCAVYFDGLDVTKELCFMRGALDLVRRGVSCLLVDGPGNGESIRFRDLPLRADYERAGSAALDYLETRDDVDAGRVGVVALSLGGYYAPRCAARDARFRACVAWGAIWDYHRTWQERVDAAFQTSMSVPGHHLLWVLGVDTMDAALHRLEDFRLEGVVQDLRCPFLLLHGERDEQVPLATARALYEAVGAADKTLRIYTAEEGGAQHCQNDLPVVATAEIADWLAERLRP